MNGLFDVGAPLAVGVRWLLLLAYSGIIGAAVMHDLVIDPRIDSTVAGRLRTLLSRAAWGALAALGLRLIMQVLAIYGAPSAIEWSGVPAILTGTTWGKAWMAQVVATVALALLADSPADATTRGVRAALLFMLGLGAAFSGHAAAIEFGAAAVLAADMLHLLAAGIWIGGLAALLATGWLACDGAAFHRIRRRFSTLALASASVLALTGITGAGSQGVTFANLTTDHYAITMLRKLVVVAVVIVLGGLNWRSTRDADARQVIPTGFARVARIEVVLGVLVLLLTAILVATETPGSGS
ncbi:MAG: CopD family protein [Gemmatimonadaceae bacterium]|nr:CopD family protein [Gemmatimonadaceae bacterium]